MERIDYHELYLLQDRVLDLVFQEETEFYLTGGTCLHRFFVEKRFSDDLDLFTHGSSGIFAYSVKEALDRMGMAGLSISKAVDSKGFVRVHVGDKAILLQVDFVHEATRHCGDYVQQGTYRLDNPRNILSNKLTALMGRDDPKDVFDIYHICHNFAFPWEEVLAEALKKSFFQKDELLFRLRTFPLSMLRSLQLINGGPPADFASELDGIIAAIRQCDWPV